MAPPGAEKHREMARAVLKSRGLLGWYEGHVGSREGAAEKKVTAALARVEADTLELAARDLDDRARSWRADGGRHDAQWKTIAGHCADTCESEAKRLRHLASNARALASEPVAGEARPSGPREA